MAEYELGATSMTPSFRGDVDLSASLYMDWTDTAVESTTVNYSPTTSGAF